MPQRKAGAIEVSKEEERYLRSAFRRFALPYVIAFAAIVWVATSVMSGEPPPGSSADVSALHEKVDALERSLAALDGRVKQVGSELEKAGSRVGALESRKPGERVADAEGTAALERSLRDATRRIAELERRGTGGAPAGERIDALVARVQRIESAARSAGPSMPYAAPTTPVPAAPAPAPAP